MKSKKLIPVAIAALFMCSCSGGKKKETESQSATEKAPVVKTDTFQKSVLIPSVIANNDAGLSYALYLPQQYSDNSKLPVLIFFDPHGEGSFPLGKYQQLSERFGVILLGSNNSKNGINFDQTNSIAEKLIKEVKERFHPNEKEVSVCGFSGGAKVVLVAGMNIKGISSLIYCGAGIPAEQVATMPPALSFAGIRDLNYPEAIETDGALEDKKISHALLEWKGKHEWPDSTVFADAFYWIRFRSMENKFDSVDHSMVNEFKNENSKFFQNPLAEWWRLKKMISFLHGVSDVSGYVALHETLIKQKEFANEVKKLQTTLSTERNIKRSYYDDIKQKDLGWWKSEINRLKNGKQDVMNDRLLGYISLLCFSVSNTAIKNNDYVLTAKTLSIYKIADPQNVDRAYLQARADALRGNKIGALLALREAVKLGLKDKVKLRQDESFASLRDMPEFKEMIK